MLFVFRCDSTLPDVYNDFERACLRLFGLPSSQGRFLFAQNKSQSICALPNCQANYGIFFVNIAPLIVCTWFSGCLFFLHQTMELNTVMRK